MELSDRLKREQEALEKQRKRVEAIKREEAAKERKADNRRKILLGACIKDWMDKDEGKRQMMMERLEVFLKRDEDRRAFGMTLSGNAGSKRKRSSGAASEGSDVSDSTVAATRA